VPDANAFTGATWVDRYIDESKAGHVRLFWSPKILEEVGRVRLWIWLRRAFRESPVPQGSSAWKTLWARYSEEAHTWFARVSLICEVIEDREPHEPAWTELMSDVNDAWPWNAAQRVSADLVVTMNLEDGPPVDASGVRRHDGITYIHPAVFMAALTILGGIFETGRAPDDLVEHVRRIVGPGSNLNPAIVAAHVRAILARMADEEAIQ
jgi:hypothetical protein